MEYYTENYIPDFEENSLTHEGVSKRDGAKVGSGRYLLGSGEHPYQRLGGLYGEYRKLHAKGLTDGQIGEALGMSSGDLRSRLQYYQALKNSRMINQCIDLKDKGKTNLEIAKEMDISPTSVANYLKASQSVKEAQIISTRNALKEKVDSVGWVDVGEGTENWMGIKRTRLDAAVTTLYDEGYELYSDLRVKQGGTDNFTTMKVLAKPGMTRGDILADKDNPDATMAGVKSRNHGLTFKKKGPAVPVTLDRIDIRYADDPVSGKNMDGIIELRRGVPDLDLGKAHYAQVRIAVDGPNATDTDDKWYAKGIAVYADDLPDGVDIRVNSNKLREQGYTKALKLQKREGDSDDPSVPFDKMNPFGTNTKEEPYLRTTSNFYDDPKTGEEKQSSLNFVNDESGWDTWSKNLPSQFLGKQAPKLAKQQLDIDAATRQKEFEDIQKLTNPVLRAKLLYDFADQCDSAAVDLKAAPLPRQATKVIIPSVSLKANEIYAPHLDDGEEVCLVRFPHSGIFEIPRLIVNNKNREAKKRISSTPADAVCINPKTAEQLSGADFDGDTVLVIPTRGVDIKNAPYLKELTGIDLHEKYATTPEEREHLSIWKKGSPREGTEMGKISNLITDMTFQKAPLDHIARAVAHSMVIIDVAKHKLNYKRSEQDYGIKELKKLYQPKFDEKTGKWSYGGAATLLSRASSDTDVPAVMSYTQINIKGKPYYDPTKPEGAKIRVKDTTMVPDRRKTGEIDPVSGKPIYETVGWKEKTRKSTKMMEADDAYTLTSGGSKEHPGTETEDVYASYANRMKALGNEARKAFVAANAAIDKKNPQAVKTYAREVSHLEYQLNEAKKNAPLERKAQAIAQAIVELEYQNSGGAMTKGEQSKRRDRELKRARDLVGASRYRIQISDKEWEAIQAGAVSKTVQNQLFRFADTDRLRELAMPKEKNTLKKAYVTLAKNMANSGYTLAEIAERFGVSTSTISEAING